MCGETFGKQISLPYTIYWDFNDCVFESRNNIRYDDYKNKNVGWKRRAGGGADLWGFYVRVMQLYNLSLITGYKDIWCNRIMIKISLLYKTKLYLTRLKTNQP